MDKIKNYFKSKALLKTALTHRSYLNESQNSEESNERMEYLGDAVLELITSEYLYKHFPDTDEGFLTALRSRLVNTKNLARIAAKIGLGRALLLSKGEEDSGGRDSEGLLANATEALIGAIYLDGGIATAKDFITKFILCDVEKMSKLPLKDAKSSLQEILQSMKMPPPKYKVLSESGPDHAKTFRVAVEANGEKLGKGEGKSKSQAETQAARKALVKLEAKR